VNADLADPPCQIYGTIGPSKLLKDLVWGLASSGLAVLRFEKITCAHPDAVRADQAFTLRDEYLAVASAARSLLEQRATVDSQRIFLLGHSPEPHRRASVPRASGITLGLPDPGQHGQAGGQRLSEASCRHGATPLVACSCAAASSLRSYSTSARPTRAMPAHGGCWPASVAISSPRWKVRSASSR
jgi:hypothetical protein